jgi:hypothetical protein
MGVQTRQIQCTNLFLFSSRKGAFSKSVPMRHSGRSPNWGCGGICSLTNDTIGEDAEQVDGSANYD